MSSSSKKTMSSQSGHGDGVRDGVQAAAEGVRMNDGVRTDTDGVQVAVKGVQRCVDGVGDGAAGKSVQMRRDGVGDGAGAKGG